MYLQTLHVHAYSRGMASSRGQREPLATSTETTWTPQLWGILIVLSGALLLDGLDVSMVGVALPSIRNALHMSTSSLQWIVSGYTLGYGGLLPLCGRGAHLLRPRRVCVAAVAVFAVVSLFGGLVSSPGLLIGARIIKGMAAAFTAPASMSLLTTTFPEGPLRNRAFSIYSVFGASGTRAARRHHADPAGRAGQPREPGLAPIRPARRGGHHRGHAAARLHRG